MELINITIKSTENMRTCLRKISCQGWENTQRSLCISRV